MNQYHVRYTDGRFENETTVQAPTIELALVEAKRQITVPYTRIELELVEFD